MNLDDSATQQEEFARENALRLRKPEPIKTGFCLECNEPSKHSYCSCDCRWLNERRNSQKKGKV